MVTLLDSESTRPDAQKHLPQMATDKPDSSTETQANTQKRQE